MAAGATESRTQDERCGTLDSTLTGQELGRLGNESAVPLHRRRRQKPDDPLGQRHELKRGDDDEAEETDRNGIGAIAESPR